jgi:hypothetical protein
MPPATARRSPFHGRRRPRTAGDNGELLSVVEVDEGRRPALTTYLGVATVRYGCLIEVTPAGLTALTHLSRSTTA